MDALSSRIGEEARVRLAAARVGVAGLGGLGSHIAVMLARSGVGALHLVDFDLVDESNLNRQHYSSLRSTACGWMPATRRRCLRASASCARPSTTPAAKPTS